MVWEWLEWLIKLLSEAENLHNISINDNISNLSFTQDKNEWKNNQRQDVDKSLACVAVFVLFFLCVCYATSSYFRRQAALAEKLGKFKSQVVIFGRRNNELSRELMLTMSQLALAEQKLMSKDSSMANIMEMSQLRAELESVRIERSALLERLQEVRVTEVRSWSSDQLMQGSWENRVLSMELKLKESESEANAMRQELELARKESTPKCLMLRVQNLLDAKNKAVAEIEELQESLHSTTNLLEDTKRDLNFERLKNERLRRRNLELQQKLEELKKASQYTPSYGTEKYYPMDPSASEEEQWMDISQSKQELESTTELQESSLSFDDTVGEGFASSKSLNIINNCVKNDIPKKEETIYAKRIENVVIQAMDKKEEIDPEYENVQKSGRNATEILEEVRGEKEESSSSDMSSVLSEISMRSVNNTDSVVDSRVSVCDLEVRNEAEVIDETVKRIYVDNNKKRMTKVNTLVNTITEEEEEDDDGEQEKEADEDENYEDDEDSDEEDEDEEEGESQEDDDDFSSEVSSIPPETFSRSERNMAIFFASPRPVSGSVAFRQFMENFTSPEIRNPCK